MKKSIILLIATILTIGLSSCGSDQTTIVIDGCQYIETTSYTSHGPVESLTHKGNCTNSIHLKMDPEQVTKPVVDSLPNMDEIRKLDSFMKILPKLRIIKDTTK